MVAIGVQQQVLAFDVFNIGRSEDRARLARRAHSQIAQTLRDSWPVEEVIHDLDTVCLWLSTRWETGQVLIEEDDPDEVLPGLSFALKPHILNTGSTILFAPPKAGKSTVALTMGVCLAQGIDAFWEVPAPRPVLYVNIERPRDLILWRERQIRRALGVTGRSGIHYINRRGAPLSSLRPKIVEFGRAHQHAVVIIDSISRTGVGRLNEDVTANTIIDTLNDACETWLAIGHSPREDSTHIYGSIHFQAGYDIGATIKSDHADNRLGVRLEVVETNHFKPPKPDFLSFTFDNDEIVLIERARDGDFPELILDQKASRYDRLAAVLSQAPNMTASLTELAAATGLDPSNALKVLRVSEAFIEVRIGGAKKWGFRDDEHMER